MIIGIHQPQYLPWIGYFDKIDKSDVFVLLDDVQFKKNEWQNRNKIRNAKDWQWLTVPVKYKFGELINQVQINNNANWRADHLKSLVTNYSKSPFFKDYKDFFSEAYERPWNNLVDINIYFIENLVKFLGIKTKLIVSSKSITVDGQSTSRLINICQQLKADTYLSGQGGKEYLDLAQFEQSGIKIEFQEFNHPTYNQVFAGFQSFMSVVDLLFNYGQDSLKIIRNKNL